MLHASVAGLGFKEPEQSHYQGRNRVQTDDGSESNWNTAAVAGGCTLRLTIDVTINDKLYISDIDVQST